MTERQRARDLKLFTETVKAEAVKLGNREHAINSCMKMDMDQTMREIDGAIYQVNFNAVYHNETVVELCGKLAAQALVLASNARRELEAFEQARDAV